MKVLSATWLTDGLIDFEYKKYILLDYLQSAKNEFSAQRLYPILPDLVMHYRNLQQVKENKKLVYERFPKRISRADFEKLEIIYEKIVKDDETMQQIEEIMQFALPRLTETVEAGKELYEFVEQHLEISPVGITPIYHNKGYLFLDPFPTSKETQVYFYQISVFENAYEKYRGIHTKFIETIRRGLTETYESLKLKLAKQNREFPNPAAFSVVAKYPFPLEQSLLPIAKRSLVKYVSDLSA